MTESSMFDPGHSQHAKPSMKNKPTTARGAPAFNPIHPSMELPPEQLIRLLSMESKKTRKHMKTRRSSAAKKSRPANDEPKILHSPEPQKSRPATAEPKIQRSPEPQNSLCASDEQDSTDSDDAKKSRQVAEEQKTHRPANPAPRKKTLDRHEQPEAKQVGRPRHHMEYERNEPAVFDKQGPGWLPSTLVIGLVAGATISGYLFWDQPSPTAKQKTPAPVVSSEPRDRRIPQQQTKSQPAKHKAAPRSKQAAATPIAPAPTPVTAPRTDNDAKWQAAIKTEQNRLRSAAEQRLAERLVKMIVNRESTDLQALQANEPAVSATPPAADPAFDQAAVSEPAPTTPESPPTQQLPVDMIQADATEPVAQADALPAAKPVLGIGGSDRNGEKFEESTGLLDRVEQDTVPDVAPAIEQEPVSNIAPSLDEDTTTAFTHSSEGNNVSDVKPSTAPEMETEQGSNGVSNETPSPAPTDSALF